MASRRAARRRGNCARAKYVHGRTDAQIIAGFERGCRWLATVVVLTFGPMMLWAAWWGW